MLDVFGEIIVMTLPDVIESGFYKKQMLPALIKVMQLYEDAPASLEVQVICDGSGEGSYKEALKVVSAFNGIQQKYSVVFHGILSGEAKDASALVWLACGEKTVSKLSTISLSSERFVAKKDVVLRETEFTKLFADVRATNSAICSVLARASGMTSYRGKYTNKTSWYEDVSTSGIVLHSRELVSRGIVNKGSISETGMF